MDDVARNNYFTEIADSLVGPIGEFQRNSQENF
jgi:hypothetical protein